MARLLLNNESDKNGVNKGVEVEMIWLLLLTVFNFSGDVGGEVALLEEETQEWGQVGEASEEEQEESDSTFANGLEIYPQPADDVLFVALSYSFGEEVHVELFDVLGCSMHREVFEGPRTMIDVSHFPQGVYFFRAQVGESRRFIRRVIIY